MSSFSPYLEKAVLDHVLGTAAFTAPSAVYVALSSTDPGADGSSITEPTYTGYARQEATFSAATGGDPSEAVNAEAIEFGDPDADGSISHFAIYDAATGGNLLIADELSAAVNYQSEVDNPISFPAGSLKVTIQ